MVVVVLWFAVLPSDSDKMVKEEWDGNENEWERVREIAGNRRNLLLALCPGIQIVFPPICVSYDHWIDITLCCTILDETQYNDIVSNI